MILDPRFPSNHLVPKVVIRTATFRADLQPIVHLGTVEVAMYPANKYLTCGMFRHATGVGLLPCWNS